MQKRNEQNKYLVMTSIGDSLYLSTEEQKNLFLKKFNVDGRFFSKIISYEDLHINDDQSFYNVCIKPGKVPEVKLGFYEDFYRNNICYVKKSTLRVNLIAENEEAAKDKALKYLHIIGNNKLIDKMKVFSVDFNSAYFKVTKGERY